jgi:EAL domain-containing protein (putative c-di-GMP-specific phosphodiesterase class I)
MLSLESQQERRRAADRRGGGRRIEEFSAALEQNQVEILFQPQFACRGNRLVGAEALSHWKHPVLGRIGVEALIDVAERSGRALELTQHIVSRSLAAALEWPGALALSLNVTATDLADERFVETIFGALAETGFPAERLTLEITEQALVTRLDSCADRLEQLTMRGIGIALDDFGAGFCNFRYLKELPLNGLKLDRSMIEGIDHDPRDRSVLRGIVAMARSLDLKVTAEGIERATQLDVIVCEGCEIWQGFLGAVPLTAEAFAALARG